MAMLLAPYNDAMRLGMGFNSYTQEICTDKAVLFSNKQLVRSENPSQIVTYSSKFVERLSDIVKSMNISYSTSIKRGTVEVAGSGNSINEDKIKESDTNAIVSVKVVNQTLIVDENCQFNAIKDILPGSPQFNEAYGDCYISGFIEGGDFNGIISIRSIDRTQADKVVSAIKKNFSTGSNGEFALNPDAFTSTTSNTDSFHNSEVTISVSWMGGGQVKHPAEPWNMTSVYAAAAAFPSLVAKCPQRTWAILTKYKANRSFTEWSRAMSFSPMEYDLVASYTSELFDNYMEYKQLLKTVQDIICNPVIYKATSKHNAIPVSTSTLIAVRAAFRVEMSKMVQAVDILSKDPGALKRNTGPATEPTDVYVRAIIRDALRGATTFFQPSFQTETVNVFPPDSLAPTTGTAPSEMTNSGILVPGQATGATSRSESFSDISNTPTIPTTTTVSNKIADNKPPSRPVVNPYDGFDFKSMIPPEIWADALPVLDETATPLPASSNISTMPKSLASLFPPAPDTDLVDLKERDKRAPIPTLEILSAVCASIDVTDSVRKLIKTPENTLTFQASAVKTMFESRGYKVEDRRCPVLSFIYRYTDQPMRLCVARSETASSGTDTTKTYNITPTSTEMPEVQPSPWNADTWSLSALVYGDKHYKDAAFLDKVKNILKTTYDNGRGNRSLAIDNFLVGEDPMPGMEKTAALFYQINEGGAMQVATGAESTIPLVLTDKRQPEPVITNPLGVEMHSGISKKQVCATKVFLDRTKTTEVLGGDKPQVVMAFPNTTQFIYRPDGNFVIVHNGSVVWQTATINPDSMRATKATMMWAWQGDGNFCMYDNGVCYWSSCTNGASHMAFSNRAPFLEFGDFNGTTWSPMWSSS